MPTTLAVDTRHRSFGNPLPADVHVRRHDMGLTAFSAAGHDHGPPQCAVEIKSPPEDNRDLQEATMAPPDATPVISSSVDMSVAVFTPYTEQN